MTDRRTSLTGSTGTGRWFATTAIVVLVLFASYDAAWSLDKLPLRGDDLDFAKRLTGSGYPDLAHKLLTQLLKKPGITNEEQTAIRTERANACQAIARTLQDADESDRWLKQARAEYKWIKENGGGKAADTRRVEYQDAMLFQRRGESVTRSVKSEKDAKRKAVLVKRGERFFDDAAKAFKAQADEMRTKIAKLRQHGGGIRNAAQIKKFRPVLVSAEYQYARCVYLKGKLYDDGSPEQKAQLTETVKLFKKFITDYPDVITMLYARYDQGLAEMELGEHTDAQTSFGDLKQMIEDEAQRAGEPAVKEVRPLQEKAIIRWAECAVELKSFAEAITEIDKMLEKERTGRESNVIQWAFMVKAKGLIGNTDKKTAADILRKALEIDGPFNREISKLLIDVTKGESGEMKPETRIALGEYLASEKKYKEAAEQFRMALKAPAGKLSRSLRFKAHKRLAEVLRYAGQVEQSIAEFKKIFATYKDQPAEEMAKLMSVYSGSLLALARQHRGDKKYDEAYVQSLKGLADTYPDTKEGRDARYFYAEALRSRGRNNIQKLLEAAAEHAQISPKSKYYGKGRYLEGECYLVVYQGYVSLGKQNIPAAKDALTKGKAKLSKLHLDVTPDVDNLDWYVKAVRALAEFHMASGKPDDALKLVNGVIEKYPKKVQSDPAMLTTLLDIYIGVKDYKEAGTKLDQLAKQGGADSGVLLRGYMKLGAAVRKDALKVMPTDVAKGEELFKQSSAFLVKSIPYVPQKPFATGLKLYSWLAGKFIEMKNYKACIDVCLKVEKLYTDNNVNPNDRLWLLRRMRARAYAQMNDWPAEGMELLKTLTAKYPKKSSVRKLNGYVLETKKDWPGALKVWKDIGRRSKPGSKLFFESKYHRALCHYELGNPNETRKIIKALMALNPKMGGPEMKKKFEDLLKKVE